MPAAPLRGPVALALGTPIAPPLGALRGPAPRADPLRCITLPLLRPFVPAEPATLGVLLPRANARAGSAPADPLADPDAGGREAEEAWSTTTGAFKLETG
eukprot:TRINITY_DN73281_c0_g1_i1.p2 TRINITY_DN73281_c0_g1~~TRINITY_DN73281_c0_g1_i1.p2  ORF type:complete len:100 (+),score=4.57 TRINITY_DN73281_c0_g1_i1:69-368(+)